MIPPPAKKVKNNPFLAIGEVLKKKSVTVFYRKRYHNLYTYISFESSVVDNY